jgi:hypothetical protein
VPPASMFKDLRCQSALTAHSGAKGLFLVTVKPAARNSDLALARSRHYLGRHGLYAGAKR